VFSKLPFSVSNRAGFGKCNIEASIDRSIELMRDRVKVHGDAISAIVLVAPGMYNCSSDILNGIVERATAANVKLVTINYPKIGHNRVPLDELALRTGGQAFTVVERKSNEEKSVLSTFFELTNVFMQISSTYHHGDAADLPVEIYRKELHDANQSGDSTKARTYTDSFSVDDATRNIHFYLYYYDRKDIGMFIDGMSLTSPNQNTFFDYTELRSDYHQLSFVSNLSGAGSWHYNVKRFNGPQPHFVQVLAYPKLDATSFIRSRAWVQRPVNGGPHVIFAEILQGNLPVIDALVEVSVRLPSGKEKKLQLFDSGSGEPDVTRGDGIYSRFFMAEDIGMHQLGVKVSDNGNTAYIQMDRGERSTLMIFHLGFGCFLKTVLR
jgi:calcium-activated chloride channel regulator 4